MNGEIFFNQCSIRVYGSVSYTGEQKVVRLHIYIARLVGAVPGVMSHLQLTKVYSQYSQLAIV